MKVEPNSFIEQELPLMSSFPVTIAELSEIIESYRSRQFSEEIDLITEHGGTQLLLEKLKTNRNTGLSSKEDHSDRLQAFGSNKFTKEKDMTYFQLCWIALQDITLRILLVSGTVSLILGSILDEHPQYAWIEGFAIIVAVFVVVNVSVINDLQKQRKFKALKKKNRSTKSVKVIRDGVLIAMHPKFLMVGDIVNVESGLIIPADGILIESSSVEVIESAMTGENEVIKKLCYKETVILRDDYFKSNPNLADNDRADRHHQLPSPVLLSGTNLSEGAGIMLVIAVGKNSAEGRIKDLTSQEEEITPLMKKLNKLTLSIGKLGIVCSVCTIIALLIRFGVDFSKGKNWDNHEDPNDLVKIFTIGITILVVAIPEGLPLAVAISLAYSVKKMQEDNNLVRKMNACETMGGADCICSDKTGTLTQNKMTVNEFWAGSAAVTSEKRSISSLQLQPNHLFLLKESIFTNTSALLDFTKGHQGSKSEVALLLFMNDIGHSDYSEMRFSYFERPHKIFPFSSKRKKSSIVITLENGRKRVHLKGASEMVLKNCNSYINSNGELMTLNDESIYMVNTVITNMTERALRVLAVAYKELITQDDYEQLDENGFPIIESKGFTLIGLAGIRDPIRPEVPDAVRKCQKAGITVRMVTGDNKSTAKAIARDCFIITSDDQIVLEGKEFAELTGGTVCSLCKIKICSCPRNATEKAKSNLPIRKDIVQNLDKFKGIINNLAVLARSAPDDKYTLVCGLRELGHVVAVTGDGTNDAPALKKADIGFAMGLAGTDIAKDAAGIILMDDNFNSIVRAVVWGRNIYDNIRCFLQFQLTVNVVAIISAVVGAVTIKQSPLTSVQLLWVNLIMDSLASLALATDPPDDSHLTRPPYKKTEFIVSKNMWKNIFSQSILQLGLMFSMMYIGEEFLPEFSHNKYIVRNGDYVGVGRLYDFEGNEVYKEKFSDPDFGPSRHFTYIFNIFVLLQVMNEINSRKLRDEINIFKGLSKNWLFIAIWFIIFGLQAIIIQVGSYAFNVSIYGLSGYQWLISIAFAITSIIWRFLMLLIPSNLFPEAGQKEREFVIDPSLLSFRSRILTRKPTFRLV